MERYETESLSAVLWERERAAKEKLEAGYDPVVMIRVVEWSGICWACVRPSGQVLPEFQTLPRLRSQVQGIAFVQTRMDLRKTP